MRYFNWSSSRAGSAFVIGVKKCEKLTLCLAHRRIPGCSHTPSRTSGNGQASVFLSKFLRDLPRTIGRSVVKHEQFEIGTRLPSPLSIAPRKNRRLLNTGITTENVG